MCDKLWQIPKQFVNWNDKIWYHGGSKNAGLGKNPLGEFMADLSKSAELSVRYTNHCVRATCITILDSEGFEACDIMTVSSHKSEQSIKSYCKTPDVRKCQMSEALANAQTSQKLVKTENTFNVTVEGNKENNPEPTVSVNSTENNQKVVESNAKDGNSDDSNLVALRDLLQLTPAQEKEFFNEIFNTDFDMPETTVNVKNDPKIMSVNRVTLFQRNVMYLL